MSCGLRVGARSARQPETWRQIKQDASGKVISFVCIAELAGLAGMEGPHHRTLSAVSAGAEGPIPGERRRLQSHRPRKQMSRNYKNSNSALRRHVHFGKLLTQRYSTHVDVPLRIASIVRNMLRGHLPLHSLASSSAGSTHRGAVCPGAVPGRSRPGDRDTEVRLVH